MFSIKKLFSNKGLKKKGLSCAWPFLIFLSFGSLTSQAQKKQAAVWNYGNGQRISFLTEPISLTSSLYNGINGIASICDSNGAYLFSSNGITIVDKNDGRMTNGFFLDPFQTQISGQDTIIQPFKIGSCTSIIPLLASVKNFHVYTVFNGNLDPYDLGGRAALLHRTVDMNLGNGLGAVIEPYSSFQKKATPVNVSNQLSCALHANGLDTWLIGRKRSTDSLMAWLVSDTGFTKTVYTKTYSPVAQPNLFLQNTVWSLLVDAQIKTSPDNQYLFVPRRTLEFPFHELYRFNNETGEFSGPVYIKDSTSSSPDFYLNGYPDGCFSPDSKTLYTCLGTRSKQNTYIQTDTAKANFWQYDVSSFDSLAIAQSKIFLGRFGRNKPNTWIPPMTPTMQLAMNGKIYISSGGYGNSDSLFSVISCPDKRGHACKIEFRKHKVLRRNGQYFPTLNQTFVRNAGIFQVQANKRKLCKGDTLEISGYGAGAERFTWSISPALPASVKVDTLTWQKISTTTIPAGSYTFTCKSSSRCGDVYEKSLVVEILPLPAPPNLSLMQKPVPCKGDSVIIQVQNAQPGTRYFWSTGDSTSSIVVKQTGLFSLDSVSNAVGCGIKVVDTVAVSIKNVLVPPVPVIAGPKVVEICEGQMAKLTIDKVQLTMKYKWNTGQVGDSVVVASGQYSVISETAEGCQSGSSDTVRVVSIPNPTPVFVNMDSVLTRETLLNQNYCVSGQPGSRFSFAVQGGTIVDSSEDCITVQWIVDSKQWIVGVTEVLANPECKGSVSQVFTYRPRLEIPSLITPNGDGLNDTFVIQDLAFYPNNHLQIFDRWGKKVLDTSNYKNDWKGEEGIYFYHLSVDGKQMSGWVQVLK